MRESLFRAALENSGSKVATIAVKTFLGKWTLQSFLNPCNLNTIDTKLSV